MKVAIYLRVSTEDQVREGYSLEVQEEYLRGYATRESHQVYSMYKDGGISGYTKERPALIRLLRDAKDNKFDLVIVYKLDRFSRNLKDLLNIVDELLSYGVGFKSATEPFDTTNSAGKLMFQQLGSFAEFERNRIKERVFPGMVKGAKNGNWQGARFAPYGYNYDKEKKLLQIVPEQAKIVKAIYSMYLMGKTTSEITAHMYHKGYRTRTGIRFHSKLICDILKNKVYTGKIVWNRRHYSKKEKTKGGYGKGYRYLPGDANDTVEAQGRHTPIISDEDFKRVQLRLANNRKAIRRIFNKYEHLLTGILKCGLCGYSYLGMTNVSNHKTKERKKWYRCRLKGETRGIECNNKNIPAASYDEFAFAVLEKVATHKVVKERRYAELLKVAGDPSDEIINSFHNVKQALNENYEKQKKLTSIYLEGGIGQEIFKETQEPLKDKEDKLKRKIRSLEMKLIEKEASEAYNNLLTSVLSNPAGARTNLTIFEKKALLRLVFKKIVVREGVIMEVELYEPFKTLLPKEDIECLLSQVKTKTRAKDVVCTYARSDVK
ncbi:MAG: recombinase family protein [Candidatus Gygaella obscura]|nr:recombinase family protein [Candidatus Gygaella obscura]